MHTAKTKPKLGKPITMAIFTPGPFAGAVSGPVGGTLFSHTRRGGVLSLRPQRRTNRGFAATRIRARMANMLLEWQNLTPNQRQAWQTAALTWPHRNRLGIASRLSGHQLFLHVNVQWFPHLTYTEGIFARTPVDLRVLPPKFPTRLDFTNGGDHLVFFEVPVPTSNSGWLIEIGRPANDRAYRTWNTWTQLGATTTGTSPTNLNLFFILRDIEIRQGERVFLRFHSTTIGAQPVLAGVLSTIEK